MSEVVDFMDEVRNTISGEIGIIHAIYTINNVKYVDVRIEDRMYYKSPFSNWEVVVKCDE